ncbi:MAG: GNAT family N-acetyltransferase [Bacteroidetes bacterium]|nr:GNAT family N-acetyltransferase [Bacteroidota bacterium]
MKQIIPPVNKDLVSAELNAERFIRKTNKGNNEIYIINNHNSPNVMLEIARLREVTFRAAGGGTGDEIDIDHFDTDPICYEQLIVYSPEDREIIGGYRFIDCSKALDRINHQAHLSTASYFTFSSIFFEKYLPHTIELGRSWVQPNFQPSVNPRKGIFALDNIWDGLGAIVVNHPEIRYFFGKVTMYSHYNAKARDMLIYFLNLYFPDAEHLLEPIVGVNYKTDISDFEGIFSGMEFADAYKVLNQSVRNLGENIPPLMNIYMNLSSTMKVFGTAINPHFGGVEETGILVAIDDIYPHKKERHINTYQKIS